MLRGAASRVGPLALRLRKARYFQDGAHLLQGVSKRYHSGNSKKLQYTTQYTQSDTKRVENYKNII